MKISPEYLMERSRNIKHLRRWKIFSMLLIFILIVFSAEYLPETSVTPSAVVSNDYIASIEINEPLYMDLERERKISALADDKKVKAVIIHLNSPGGTAVGSEMLYNSISKLAKKKPTVSVIGTVAASGGYMAALGTDYIIAHNSSVTGSIGVVAQVPEVTELMESWGVKLNHFKTSELKAAPNPFEKVTPEVRQAIMENIYDTYDFFVGLVAKERNMTAEEVAKIADGRVFSGRTSLELGLIDEIGDEDTAISWLQTEREISDKLKVKTYKLKKVPSYLSGFFDEFEERVKISVGGAFQGVKTMYMGY